MDKGIEQLFRNWERRNISGFYVSTGLEASEKLLGLIPLSASVGISGSQTLDEIGIVKRLEARGNKVFNQYKAGLSRQDSLELRQQGAAADYYLTSANAVSLKGELVFFSANGHRIAGIANARNVIVVAGKNKISPELEEAMKRSREYATPLNCKRLNWQSACAKDGICRKEVCLLPENKRMCCQVLIIEAEVSPDRLKVILVGENLGF